MHSCSLLYHKNKIKNIITEKMIQIADLCFFRQKKSYVL